uniref:Cytochrome P450 n=1 Tax=Oryza nivara TaxID=4536 RepID=A0A0E0FIU0_ORYNI
MAVSLLPAVLVLLAIVAPLLYLVLLPAVKYTTSNGAARWEDDDGGDGRRRRRLPPSPRGLPLLGHLHLLGALPHRALRSLAAAHGPVLLLRLGRVPAVVVSSAAAAEEVMRSRDLQAVVGVTGCVTEDHIDRLPYLKAVLKETLRLHPPNPLLVPHVPLADTEILGYTVPTHTRVLINAWTIGRDPATWGEHAEKFIPERFLNNNVDYKGQDFGLVPFGAGRRGCPGMGFAVPTIEMALASLLYNFSWETRPVDRRCKSGTSSLDMSEMNGISVRLKYGLPLIAKSHFP